MRQKMRRFAQGSVFLSMLLIGVVVFQNCGSYQPDFNPLYDTEYQSTCSGFSCAADKRGILIDVANQNLRVLQLQTDVPYPGDQPCGLHNCFDISGYCDTGLYPDSKIMVRLDGETGFKETDTETRCDSIGRFGFQVKLPKGYNYKEHRLVVILYGVDPDGRLLSNPDGRNQFEIPVTRYLIPTPTATPIQQ